MKFVIIAVGIFFFFMIIKLSWGSYENALKEQSSQQQTSQQQTKPKPSKPMKWVAVHELKGRDMKNGPSFQLSGSKSRLKYKYKASGGIGMGAFNVYILPEGHDLMKQGGFPSVSGNTPEQEDETYFHKSAGSYYLSVNAIGKWSIIIEELK